MDQILEPKIHFHIRWAEKNRLDWECFDSLPDALGRALELAAPHEGFRIEEVSGDCPFHSSKAAVSAG